MHTKDRDGREIQDGDRVRWNWPPVHFAKTYEGEVVGLMRGGWIVVRVEGDRRLETVKPFGCVVIEKGEATERQKVLAEVWDLLNDAGKRKAADLVASHFSQDHWSEA